MSQTEGQSKKNGVHSYYTKLGLLVYA